FASKEGSFEIAQLLIEKGANVNARNEYGETPLHFASKEGSFEIAQLLIERGANVNAKAKYSHTPLHYASEGYLDIAKLLIEKGADVNAKISDDLRYYAGYTPLHFASKEGSFEIAQLLIEKGADVNAKNEFGETPLHLASTDMAELLIEKGANVNARNEYGETPLHYLKGYLGMAMAELLIEKGADVNAKAKYGYTPLHFAVYKEEFEIAKLLIEKGADVNAVVSSKDRYYAGYSALHFVAQNTKKYINIERIAFLLIQNHANLDIVAKNGLTASQVAKNCSNEDVGLLISNPDYKLFGYYWINDIQMLVKLLTDKPELSNLLNSEGQTIWHLAVKENNEEVLNFLYSNKMLINAQNIHGQTVLLCAIELGKKEIVFNLIDAGADINIADKQGFSPYAVAKFHKYNEILDVLVMNNADTTIHIKPVLTIKQGHNKWVPSVCFSPDGKTLASIQSFTIELCDVQSGNLLKTMEDVWEDFTSVCFSPDGKTLASGGEFGLITLWDLHRKKKIKRFKGPNYKYGGDFCYITSVCFSPDGKTLASGSLKNLELWDVQRGKLFKSFVGHTSYVTSVSFSPDGKTIASGSWDEIKIWDIATGNALSFVGHKNRVLNVQFMADTTKIVSVDETGVIIYWDIATQKQLAAIYPVGDSLTVVVTPEGYFDGTPEALRYLYYVQGTDIIPLEAYYEQFYRSNLLQRILRGDAIEQSQVDFNKRKPNSGVKITEPAQGDYRSINMPVPTNANLLKLKASFTDNGGGVEEVRVYRNNKLVHSEIIGLNKPCESISRSFDVPLMPGINTITVSVFNSDRTEICDTIKMNFSGSITEMPNLYLVCIGINEYENPQYHLNFAVSDALSFSKAIETGAKTLFGNIYTYNITDRDATKANITKILNEVQSKAKPWDVFVFYYAGHGAAISEDGRTNFYFINSDVTNIYSKEQLTGKAISNSELLFFSRDIQAEKQFLVIDACNSGAAGDLLAYRSGPEEERAIAVLARSTGTHFLFASTANQLAKEIPEIGHGVFTYCMLKAMTGGDGIYSEGKSLTVKDISNYTEKQVPELSVTYTPTKTPQYPTAYSYGQDFPLVITGNLLDFKTLKGKYDDYSIEQLQEMKAKAIEVEDYQKADEIKKEIQKRSNY
ncbi:MAG TPA: ankyrin repeat domain-containing protein, partial [Bacteroidales bacterium]|nr:ankyrin repeat domain-containing protein [Bacteroidales bacterium]